MRHEGYIPQKKRGRYARPQLEIELLRQSISWRLHRQSCIGCIKPYNRGAFGPVGQ